MVGPSFSDDERERSIRRFKIGFALLVAASSGLVAHQAGGDTTTIAGALAGGLVLGVVLTWFVSRSLQAVQPEGLRERRERMRNR